MKDISVFACVGAVLFLAACANSGVRGEVERGSVIAINNDYGGAIQEYQNTYAGYLERGVIVHIVGACYSACTLVLAYLPSEHICVTRAAVLGFHEASLDTRRYKMRETQNALSGLATVVSLYGAYPYWVQQWIDERGGLTKKMAYLRFDTLSHIYAECM